MTDGCKIVTIAAPITPATFLLDTGIQISPSVPVVGSQATLTGIVRNVGGTSGTITVYANMGGTRMGQASYTVGAGLPQNVSIGFIITAGKPAGNYDFCLAFT